MEGTTSACEKLPKVCEANKSWWNPKNHFKIKIIPYFNDKKCSVESCDATASYTYSYRVYQPLTKNLGEHGYGHGTMKYGMLPTINGFHLCKLHESQKFLELPIVSARLY